MKTTVIIMSHRPGDWLAPAIRSAQVQATEVIVVDNGSEGSRVGDLAREAGAGVVRLRANAGFAGGVAAALGGAGGDLIGVLNDDAVAGPGWLESAARELAAPEVAAVTPKVVLAGLWAEVVLADEVWHAPGDARDLGRRITALTVDGRDVLARALGAGIHEYEIDPGGRPERWRWGAGPRPFYVPLGPDGSGTVEVDGEPVAAGAVVRLLNHAGSWLLGHGVAAEVGLGAPDDGRFDGRTEPFGFSGTAPVFRAETLRRLGSFAPQFFAYTEDTDWCLRARLAGMRIVYDPGAVVEHRLSATSGGTYAEQVKRLAQRNALLCLVRNAPAAVAREHVRARLAWDWRGPVGRSVLAKLPWAVASRGLLSRHWRVDPAEVWDRWADAGGDWDRSPARRSLR